MEELTCPVCSEAYATRTREPVILPKCGHTFCRPCLANLQMISPAFKCPTCRAVHKGPTVASLPTVFIVLNILEKIEKEKGTLNVCKIHDDPLRLWCRMCQEELCGQCLYESHMSEKHEIIKTDAAIAEMKQTIEIKAKQIIGVIEEDKSNLVQELHNILYELGKLYSKSQVLGSHSRKVMDILRISKSSTQIRTLITGRRALDNMIKQLRPSLVAKTTAMTPSERENIHNERTLDANPSKQYKEYQVQRRISYLETEMNSEAEAFELSDDDSDSIQIEEIQETNFSKISSHTSESQRILPSDVTVWPLSKHAPGGKTDWPKINWYSFLAQIPVVQLLVPPENAQVFLHLGAKGKSLGFIHIQLWGRLLRAQHFLALCLGTLGPSYKGSKFSDVAKRGEPGERLIGGLYETEEGFTGQQIIDGLEWRGEYTGPMKAGVVGGSRGRQPRYNSCFCISTRDYPKGKYYCPFGEVVLGLEVAQEAVLYDPINEVTILDCGLVSPHCDL
ncbi:hypothetical protein SK128_024095 [Halocaridina rubra]|uniref:Uncharacterized protein n=1 Tax=Halocaridina rubra TaxID=373956 RepID=A0AAN9ADT4_HALRR